MQVLQFSGGKDSLALLHFMEPSWDELTVVWLNTGAAFPETIEQMARVREMVPKFVEIKSSQSIDTEGYPADVVPIASTSLGQLVEGTVGRRFQSRYSCCAAAMWIPMHAAMKEMGVTVVYRGQKSADKRTNRIPSGTVVENVRYEFPLEDWTDAQIHHYLRERDIALPANYRSMSTGLDCWNCTAYLDENIGKFKYMQQHHPQKHAIVQDVLLDLQQALHRDLSPLREIKANYS